jgi:hypothetical protein
MMPPFSSSPLPTRTRPCVFAADTAAVTVTIHPVLAILGLLVGVEELGYPPVVLAHTDLVVAAVQIGTGLRVVVVSDTSRVLIQTR